MISNSTFEGMWKEIRRKSKEWWSLINEIDLGRVDKAPNKLAKYVVLLQVKYGYTREIAGEQINRRVLEHQVEEQQARKS